jgi:hypothetical protein
MTKVQYQTPAIKSSLLPRHPLAVIANCHLGEAIPVPETTIKANLPQGTSFDALSFAQDWQSSPLKAAPQSKSNNQEKTYFLGSRLIHSNAEE